MDKKKILIVTYGFFPDLSPRSLRSAELVKEFCRQGHVVKVIAPYRQGVESLQKEFSFTFKDLGKVTWKVPQLPINNKLTYLLNRALTRGLKLLLEYPRIQLLWKTKHALKNEAGFDLLISIAIPYPIHWGVASVLEKNKMAKLWVADCGDPYIGAENDNLKKPFYFKYIEKWFCRKVDYLTVPTPTSYLGYYKEFHSKIKVIPQGFRFEDIKIAEYKPNKRPTFAYAGQLMKKRRDPGELCEYLLQKGQDFEFHLYTKAVDLVESYAKKSDGRIIIHDFLPRRKLLFELSKMDFMVNFENKGVSQTPSKIIDYTIINKPILSIKPGSLDPQIVDEFLIGNYSNAYRIEDPNIYRIENVTKQFLSLVS